MLPQYGARVRGRHRAPIHPDKLAQIFDPFVELDRALTTPGSQHGVGLGLAISRDLVRQLGGELTVESLPGAGSTFRFTLPRGAPNVRATNA